MRYIRYLCIAVFAIALIAVALANRQMVTLQVLPVDAMPGELVNLFAVQPSITLPLFFVILGSVLVGLLMGFVWEWIREHGERAEKARLARETRKLEREVARLKTEKHEGKDDVLALLDEAS